jgi:hypothetical protein
VALAETARLVSSLELNTSKFDSGIRNAGSSLGKLSGSLAKSRAVAVGLGVGLERVAEKGISSLAGAIGNGIEQVQLLEKANQQTAAAIASTGGVAGVTAAQVRDLAQAQEDLTTVDDKVVQQGENLLLTFRGIGKDIFPQATAAITNMAVALNKGDAATADLDASAIRVGKALQDPIKGITALSRVGVVFTADQKKQITGFFELNKQEQKHYAQLVKTNPKEAARFKAIHDANATVKAQKVILAELDKEFGKAGAAAGTGFTADVNRARDAIDDAEAAIATGLIPAVGEVARQLTTTLRDPQVIQGLKDLGTGIGDVIKGGVAFAKTVPWGTIASSLKTAAGFAKDLLNAFLGLPTWVQTAVITGWGLNKLTGGALGDIVGSLATGLIKGVLGINAGVVNVNAASVAGLSTGTGAAAATGTGVASKGIGLLGKVALIGETVGLVAAVAQVSSAISDASSQQASAISSQTSQFIAAQPSQADLQKALDGVNQGINDLQSNPLNVFVQGSALDQLKAMRAELAKSITANGILAAGASRDSETSSSIAGAIKAAKPTVNVKVDISATTITKKTTIQNRYGPIAGTREGSSRQNEGIN